MRLQLRGALIKVGNQKEITGTFRLQDIYLDTSTFNQFTGERYPNVAKLQNVNNRVDMSEFKPGQMLQVDAYLNGRSYSRDDGTNYFIQNLNISGVKLVRNTSGEIVVVDDDQLMNVNID